MITRTDHSLFSIMRSKRDTRTKNYREVVQQRITSNNAKWQENFFIRVQGNLQLFAVRSKPQSFCLNFLLGASCTWPTLLDSSLILREAPRASIMKFRWARPRFCSRNSFRLLGVSRRYSCSRNALKKFLRGCSLVGRQDGWLRSFVYSFFSGLT